MHVVGDAQRQPTKSRHCTENFIRAIYDMTITVKFITFLIVLATTTIAAKKTFGSDLWAPNGFSLSPVLQYKLRNCTFATTRDLYAFKNVSMSIDFYNNAELFTDYGGQLRMGLVIAALCVVLGAINRELFRGNAFFIRLRHMYFHKDVLTTIEVFFLAFLFYTFYHLLEQQVLLQDYLRGCGVKRDRYLPFVSFTPIWIFVGVAASSFVIATIVLLVNAVGQNVDPVPRDREDEEDDERIAAEEIDRLSAELATVDSVGLASANNYFGVNSGRRGGSIRNRQTANVGQRRASPVAPSPMAGSTRGGVKGNLTAPPPPPDSFYLVQQQQRM